MVNHSGSNENEHHLPDAFSACEAIFTQINAFPDEFPNDELTLAHIPLICECSAQLLEDMKVALSEARTKVPVESRHMWVKSLIERYEEAVAVMEKTGIKLQAVDKRNKQVLLIQDLLSRMSDLEVERRRLAARHSWRWRGLRNRLIEIAAGVCRRCNSDSSRFL